MMIVLRNLSLTIVNSQISLDDPLAVEVEGFEPVQKKPQLHNDTS